jgi:hypothetical protein
METLNEPAALTANEQALDALSLEGFNKASTETESLTDRLMAVMGIKQDQDSGSFIQMTKEERFAALPEEEQLIATGLEQQIDRQNKLIAGDIAPSAALTERGQLNFDALKEFQARKGNTISGEGINDASAGSTSGIQALSSLRSEHNLAVDTERRADIADLDSSINNRAGLLSNLQNRRVNQISAIPGRNILSKEASNFAGLLRDKNIEAQAQFTTDAAGLLTRLIT